MPLDPKPQIPSDATDRLADRPSRRGLSRDASPRQNGRAGRILGSDLVAILLSGLERRSGADEPDSSGTSLAAAMPPVALAATSNGETPLAPAGGIAPLVRRLDGVDRSIVCAHLKRLDQKSRDLRFGSPVNDAFLERYGVKAIGDRSIVLGCFVDGTLRGIAELMLLDTAGQEGEGAISIEAAFQSLGFGGQLFGLLIESARLRGTRRVMLNYLRRNERIQSIASRHGAKLDFRKDGAIAKIGRTGFGFPPGTEDYLGVDGYFDVEDELSCALITLQTSRLQTLIEKICK